MAPATSVDDTVKFLVVCIKHTNGGKVDFKKVAEECEIVTKEAAAKRFERLLKKYNTSGNGNGAAGSADAPKAAKKAPRKRKAPAPKKRKTAPSDDEEDDLAKPLVVEDDYEEPEDEVLVA